MKRVSAESNFEDLDKPIEIDYADISNPDADLDDKLKKAFGLDGLGLCIVTNIPDIEKNRKALLSLINDLASLDDDTLRGLMHPETLCTSGWSVGINANPDLSKASFYANPQLDNPKRDMDG
jgi:hypothetical protein